MNVAAYVEYRTDVKTYFLHMEAGDLTTFVRLGEDQVWDVLADLHAIEEGESYRKNATARKNSYGVEMLQLYSQHSLGVLICWHGEEGSTIATVKDADSLKDSCTAALLRSGVDSARILTYL